MLNMAAPARPPQHIAAWIVAGAITLLGLVYAAQVAEIGTRGSLFALGVAFWNATPFFGVAGLALLFRSSFAALATPPIAAVLLAVWTSRMIDGVDEDAQGALLLLFGPLWAWGGVLVTACVAALMLVIGRTLAVAWQGE